MNPEQTTTLRNAVLAEPSLQSAIQSANDDAIKNWLNAAASPAWYVWRSTTDGDAVMDSIDWASLTPAGAVGSTQQYANNTLACQSRQISLQILLQGRSSIATGKANIRKGLSDALIDVPAGANGALLDAGWLGNGKVKATITRTATRAEKLLSTGTGTAGLPATLGWEGEITPAEASLLR